VDTCASPWESLVASPVSLMMSSRAARLSCQWGGACLRYILALARSQMVSVRLQKRGGEFTHPMVSTRGMATSGGNPQHLGRTTAREGLVNMLHNLFMVSGTGGKVGGA